MASEGLDLDFDEVFSMLPEVSIDIASPSGVGQVSIADQLLEAITDDTRSHSPLQATSQESSAPTDLSAILDLLPEELNAEPNNPDQIEADRIMDLISAPDPNPDVAPLSTDAPLASPHSPVHRNAPSPPLPVVDPDDVAIIRESVEAPVAGPSSASAPIATQGPMPQPSPIPDGVEYLELVARALLYYGHPVIVSQVYDWIQNNCVAKTRAKYWRNSVRHVLTKTQYFQKCGHSEQGNSNYWGIHPHYMQAFKSGHFKKKAISHFIRESHQRYEQSPRGRRYHPYQAGTSRDAGAPPLRQAPFDLLLFPQGSQYPILAQAMPPNHAQHTPPVDMQQYMSQHQ